MTAIQTFKRAGLKPRHLAKFLPVSRVAASRWLNGHSSPHCLVAQRVDKFAAIIEIALAAGELPIPQGIDTSEEYTYLTAVIRKYGAAKPASK